MKNIALINHQGKTIILTQERWQHIITRHPEMKNKQDLMIKTINKPEFIIQNDLDNDIHLYHRYNSDNNCIVIVVHEKKNFIITSYINEKEEGYKNMAKKLNLFYDKEGDILDISLGKPQESVSLEISDDLFVRLDHNRNVVGFMLMNFEKRYTLGKQPDYLPINAQFNVPKSYLA